MKKLLILVIAVLLFYTQNSAQTHHFKFKVQNKSELKKITQLISIENYKENFVWAYANDKEFEEFSKLGYKTENLSLNDSKGKVINMATTVAQMANWDRYPTYGVYTQMMQNFATNYPSICKLDTISDTQNGRKVLVLKISDNVASNEAEPEFFYTSTMHGDETTGFVLMLRLADYLLSNYGTNTEATDLVNNFEIYINPDANPDGTYYGGDNDVSGSRRSLANGDDPNRDFPYPLDINSTSSNPETIGMEDFATAHHFVMSANFHGGAEVYNYPWDCWTTNENAPADAVWWEHIGRAYVDSARLINSGYMTSVVSSGVTEGADWYYAYGSRQDYMNYFHHCKEVTLELSNTKTLSTDQLNNYWNYNERSLINYIKEAGYGFNGTVKNTNGDPLDAKIEISSLDKDNSWVVTDPVNGDYYRPIASGTYNVIYSSYGYISQTISVTVTDWETTTIQDVILQQAATVDITGTVIENGSGNPLENVKIEFLNTPISPVFTSADGTYTVTGVMENNYDIKASKTGYTAVTQNIDISTSNTVVDFTLAISNAISFESEVPSIFTFEGNQPWTRVQGGAYDGDYSMKSGNISDNQTSVMKTELNITAAGDISFYKKVSSESTYDKLNFYIDGTLKDSWSGTIDWSQESYSINTTGLHTFKWEYSKDGSVSNGDDCAWVDYIEFPQYQVPPTYSVTFHVTDGTNNIQDATVTFNSQNKNTDANGETVFTEVDPGNNLPWTVSKSGYYTENGTLNIIDSDINKEVILSEIVTYTVTFSVTDASSAAIEGANITFNSQNMNTDAGGQAVFSSVETGNNLPYIITKAGYSDYNGTLSVIDSDVNEDVTMYDVTYTVTFVINDGTNPVENASINFDSQDILTDINGHAVFNNVPAGNNMPYTIVKSGFNTNNGTLNINSDVYQTISLTTSVNVEVLLSLSGIKISPNPFKNFTLIEFYIDKMSDVEINIYSYQGQIIKSFKLDNLPAGNHQVIWNASDNSSKKVSNGIYFIKIKSENGTKTAKIILAN